VSDIAFERPVDDSVQKINDEVAVGEDLQFQRRWWKFEGIMWWIITAVLLLNFAGVFGRGPLSHAQMSNDAMDVKYERVERTGTPAILKMEFNSAALHAGKVKMHVSQSLVEELGAQRVVPSPLESAVGGGGITYTFSAEQAPGAVEFALRPPKPGVYYFTIQVAGSSALSARVIVVP
jgi:hypothetical protein